MASDKSEVVLYWNGGRGFGFIAPDVRDSSSGKGSGRWHLKQYTFYHRKN